VQYKDICTGCITSKTRSVMW